MRRRAVGVGVGVGACGCRLCVGSVLIVFCACVQLFLGCRLWACAVCAYCVCILHDVGWGDEYSLLLRGCRLWLAYCGLANAVAGIIVVVAVGF